MKREVLASVWARPQRAAGRTDLAMAERTLQRQREAPDELRWLGRLAGDEQQRTWNGPDCETVTGKMNADLGAVDDSEYRIVEGT